MRIPQDLAHTLAVTVELGSLDAAAAELHLTQSAVTQRLQTLERLAGQVLLVRSRPVHATPAGEVVIRLARQIAHLDEEAAQSLGIATHQRPSIAIGVNSDSLSTWFLPPLARLSASHDVTFDIHRDDEDRTADLLADGTVVAAVTTRSAPVPGCTVTALGEVMYSAVCSVSFAARWFPDGVTDASLAVAPMIEMDAYDTLQSAYLDKRGVDTAAPPRHRVPGAGDLVRAIDLGMGWAVLPGLQRGWLGDAVDMGGPVVRVPLYWQQWRVHSDLLSHVATEIAAEASRLL